MRKLRFFAELFENVAIEDVKPDRASLTPNSTLGLAMRIIPSRLVGKFQNLVAQGQAQVPRSVGLVLFDCIHPGLKLSVLPVDSPALPCKPGRVQFAEDNMRGLFMANLSSIGVALSAYLF